MYFHALLMSSKGKKNYCSKGRSNFIFDPLKKVIRTKKKPIFFPLRFVNLNSILKESGILTLTIERYALVSKLH